MGIKINKVLVIASFGVAFLIVLASFSSVVGFQTVKSNHKNVTQLLKNRTQRTFGSLGKKTGEPLLLQKLVNIKQIFQKLTDIISNIHTNKLKLLISRNPLIHNTITNEPIPERMALVLVLTILTEFFVYLATVQSSAFALLFLSVVINAITNPAINFIYYYVYNNVFVLESLVFIIESFMIYILFNAFSLKISFAKAVLLSLVANVASYVFATGFAQLVYDNLLS